MIFSMTGKECALHQCAYMILHDQCPPDREYYLCMKGEDDSTVDCVECWGAYLRGIAEGSVELPKAGRGVAV